MALFKDADGNEVEAFSQEEVEAKTAEAVEAVKAETQAAISDAETKVQALEGEVSKLRENNNNAGALREKTEALEKAKGDLETKIQAATSAAEDAKKQVQQMATDRLAEVKDTAIASLAGGDEELKKKITFNFEKRVAGPIGTKAEIEARVRDAYILATGKPATGVLVGAAISSAGGGSGGGGVDFTPEQQELAQKLGIKPESLKKYGNKA